MFGGKLWAVYTTAYSVFYRLACSCPEECPRSRSRLACNERLANALNLPPNGRGGRTPLDKRDGLPVVHFHKCMASDFQTSCESALNSYTTCSDATLR